MPLARFRLPLAGPILAPFLALLLGATAPGCGDEGGGDDGGDDGGGDGGADREPDLGPKDPRSCEPGGDAGTCPGMGEATETVVGLVLAGGFERPRLLAAPVRSSGWEDSPFPLADGTLLFAYSRSDAFAAKGGKPAALDDRAPARCGAPGDGWALYRAVPGCDARFYVDALPVPPNAATGDVAAPSLTADRRSLYVAVASAGGPRRIAHAFAPAGGGFGAASLVTFSAPGTSGSCIDDHPSVLPDGLGVVFESNRDDPAATTCSSPRRLWRVYASGGGWAPPELLTRSECAFSRGNISASGLELVFTVAAEQPACALAPSPGIWRVGLNGQPAPMGAATRLVRIEPPSTTLLAVEDGAASPDGKVLYFSVVTADGPRHLDVSLALAEKP